MIAKRDEEISDLKARLNILENVNTVDGVEQPQSSIQEPPPALQPMVVSDSESDDGDEETDRQRRRNTTTKSNAKEIMKIALERSEPWKCVACFRLFSTNTGLRQHFVVNHKDRKICKRCPYICERQSDLAKHEQSHFTRDAKFKKTPRGQECKLCNVWFGGMGNGLENHTKFHLPNEN